MTTTPRAPSVIDLFAGCGGMTQGFVDAGFEPVMAVEFDPSAAATYAVNFDPELGHTWCSDIAAVASADVPKANVVIGGPPCQGFSALGLQEKDDPRNKLWTEYVRIVRAAEPDIFVIENVDRFLSSGEFSRLEFEATVGDLSDYELTACVLNAADYGVPQRRKRTIVIGARGRALQAPLPTHTSGLRLGESPWVTVADALAGVERDPRPSDSLVESNVEMFDHTIPGTFTMEELHFGREPWPISLERYAVIPPGGGRFDLMRERPDLLPPCWRKKPRGTTDVMGRLEWDQPAVTIRTEFFKPEKGRYLHPQWHPTDASKRVDRPITHREAALLQTFPEQYLWCGTKIEIARQIGNAVPPLLAREIATTVQRALTADTTQAA